MEIRGVLLIAWLVLALDLDISHFLHSDPNNLNLTAVISAGIIRIIISG